MNFLCTLCQITIKEEDRLASVVSDIDHDVRIVPRGAFVKTPTGQIFGNRSFEGRMRSILVNLRCPINVDKVLIHPKLSKI